jgi:hypothetical protein
MFQFSPFSFEGKGSGIGVFNRSTYEAPFPKVEKKLFIVKIVTIKRFSNSFFDFKDKISIFPTSRKYTYFIKYYSMIQEILKEEIIDRDFYLTNIKKYFNTPLIKVII